MIDTLIPTLSSTLLIVEILCAGLFLFLTRAPLSNGIEKQNYRGDLDGLRALAVLPVLLFHAAPHFLPGGFAGVDIFFVISGFLISQHLMNDLDAGRYSLGRFYGKRIRRLFPALIVVLVSCLVAGIWLLYPEAYEELSRQVIAGGLFSSNLLQWSEAGYFDKAASGKILLHLWSLGVEEQFYLIWPLVLFVAHKFRWNKITVMLLLLGASFFTNIFGVSLWPTASFYLLFSRLWELALGGLTAAFYAKNSQLPSHVRHGFSVVGLTLIVVGYAVINSRVAFPGWYALLPTTGAALLIGAGPKAIANRTVLRMPFLVSVGIISYPLYLWHWPLLSFLFILHPDAELTVPFGLLELSVLLAWLTYRYVETPVRALTSERLRRDAAIGLCGILLVVMFIGVGGIVSHGLAFRLPPFIRSLEAAFKYEDMKKFWRGGECFYTEPGTPFASTCIDQQPQNTPLLVAWGDSHVAMLNMGLRMIQKDHSFRLAEFSLGSCPPILNYDDDLRPLEYKQNCALQNRETFEIIRQIKPDILLIGGHWGRYQGRPTWPENFAKLGETIAAMQALGIKKIILLGAVPEWSGGLQHVFYEQWKKDPSRPVPMRLPLDENPVNQRLEALARQQSITFISMRATFCDEHDCLARFGDKAEDLLTWDDGHFTPEASEYFIRKIEPQLFP